MMSLEKLQENPEKSGEERKLQLIVNKKLQIKLMEKYI